jgi:hypothetical protein
MIAVRLAALILVLAATPVAAQSVDEVNERLDTLYGSHESLEAAFEVLQEAVAAGDAETVASLVWYPFDVTIDGEDYRLPDDAAFVERYEEIFTRALAETVTAQSYADLFVNDEGVMVGDGELWLSSSCLDSQCERSVWLISAINDTTE